MILVSSGLMAAAAHSPQSWRLIRALPEQFLDVPYAPFGKSDRLGRAADFTAPLYYQTKVFREWHRRRDL